MRVYRGNGGLIPFILYLELDGEWSFSCTYHFTKGEGTTVPIV